MINKYVTTALVATTLFAGCSPSKDKAEAEKEAVVKQIDKAQDAVKDAAMDLKTYTYERKTEFVAAMKKQVASLETNIKELSSMIEKSSDKVKTDARPKLAALREQSALLAKQVEDISKSTPTTWDGIKADTHKAYVALKDSLTQARQWVSDQVEP
jgi:cytochrome c556